jgi:hypothetical protein
MIHSAKLCLLIYLDKFFDLNPSAANLGITRTPLGSSSIGGSSSGVTGSNTGYAILECKK